MTIEAIKKEIAAELDFYKEEERHYSESEKNAKTEDAKNYAHTCWFGAFSRVKELEHLLEFVEEN